MNKIFLEGKQYIENQIQIACYDERLHFINITLQ